MSTLSKIGAVCEVGIVTFAVVPFVTLGVYWLFPHFEKWQTDVLGFPFPVFGQVVMMCVVLLAVIARRKEPAEYGLKFDHSAFQLGVAGACFIPFVLASMPLGLGVDHKSWGGALVLAVVQIGLLFVLALLLRRDSISSPRVVAGGGTVILVLLAGIVAISGVPAGRAVALFLAYAFFVGLGEEMLYRGYLQSRLNEAFGRPFSFFGVPFGWGAIITAVLFGFTHVGILSWALGLTSEVTLAWGFWTIFSGLVFGFVREKSGGILAPTLLHGLPQAIASVALLAL